MRIYMYIYLLTYVYTIEGKTDLNSVTTINRNKRDVF